VIAKRGRIARTSQRIVMMNGERVNCGASSVVSVRVSGKECVLDCLVADILPGFQMLLGMDAIAAVGGVKIGGSGLVTFNETAACAATAEPAAKMRLQVQDEDFSAVFAEGKWVVKWSWKLDGKSPALKNGVAQYSVADDARTAFDEEVRDWIKCGWLQPFEGHYDGLVPLMAVVQCNKGKVRPVMDYRELNQHVSSHTGESDVCGEKLRKWRRSGTNVKMLDLRKAYLQLHVSPELWKYQVVKFESKTYCLTRLGFGLNVALKIMTSVVNAVLSQDPEIRAGTD
jgi:hypothetical protein